MQNREKKNRRQFFYREKLGENVEESNKNG